MNKFWLITLGGLLGILMGCATPQRASRVPLTGDPLVDGPIALSQGPPRDKVLWQYRMAAAAMRRGQFQEAKRLLDDALLRVGSIYAEDKSAKKARSYFAEEAKKTFLGEPYERVMAYYYRGILYWMDGEPDNARACFRNAQVQDSDTENRQYASDYVLLDYLDGLATTKLASDGSDAFKRAKASSKSILPPPYDPQANVLFFLECGDGPAKYATGQYREELRFRPGKSEARLVEIRCGGQTIRISPYDDLTFQATTRGGRVMDHILANKVVFKKTTDTVGNVALVGGLLMATDRNLRDAGLGLAAVGLVSKVVAAATTPAADTRCWDNLPQYLSFAALRLPPGEHNASVEFMTESGRTLAAQTRTVKFVVPSDRDAVIFVSNRF